MEIAAWQPLGKLPHSARWGVLVAGSIVFSALLELAGLPAALLLGAMIAAILVEIGGGGLRVPRLPYHASQAVLGCLVARLITPTIIGTFAKDWLLFISVVLSVVVAASLLGWLLSRSRIFPGTTAIWGLSPGAASVMMLMAGAYGADVRLVAFMQYLRVVCLAIAASLIARLVGAHGPSVAVVWFPAIHWTVFGETIALGLIGGILGRLSKIPAGVFLFPMFAGAALHGSGWMEIELPPWLLAVSYAVLGWSIGTGFTLEILAHAFRTLPQTLLSILTLMLFCGGLAFVLVKEAGIDPLTAYFATSPGGLDTAAIIAASSHVDVSFVIALQTVRFTIILLIGPAISRFFANYIGDDKASSTGTEKDEAKILKQVKEDEDELD